MLIVSKLTKQFRGAPSPILKNINLIVNAGERVGLIGPNGSGKSTLLKIIVGEEQADSGSVIFNPPKLRIGYLAQGLTVPDDTPVVEALFPQARMAEAELARLSEAIAAGDETVIEAYNAALERIAALNYATHAAERTLAGLGLSVTLETPVGHLSGGQKTRLNLAAILLNKPQLLVLDEPTNHLDIRALEWLEGWLREFSGGVLIVSHDRAFLDRVVNRVVAINPETAEARVFAGNYTDYLETIRRERDKRWAEWKDQQVESERLKRDVERTMARAVRKENATNNDQQRRYAKKVAKRAKAKEKRLERYLESDERVEKPTRTWDMKLDFDQLPRAYGIPLRLENLSIGYDRPLLSGLNLTVKDGERIAIMGPNGHGKSTLLKTIIGEIEPLTGYVRRASGVQIGYLAQEQDILDLGSTPLETLQAHARMGHTEARSFLHYFLFTGDEVFRPIEMLSYGERSRLMLALLVARGANLLVMDEPLNHLDLPAREKFEQALGTFPGYVLAVVHDRYFVEKFATSIWHIADGDLRVEIRQSEEV